MIRIPRIRLFIFIFIATLLVTVNSFEAVAAFGGTLEQGIQEARGAGQPSDLFGMNGIFTTVANTLLYLVGALSVVMIIYGGLRYVISGGSSTAVTAAKNTILYAVMGLVISVLSYAVINFILATMMSAGTGGGSMGGGNGWSNL